VIDHRGKDWDRAAFAGLIALIFVHQLLEYLGQVAQWSWYGALVPAETRGQVFSKRQALQLTFVIPISWAMSYAVDWINMATNSKSWGYAAVHLLGSGFLLASVVVLRRLPSGEKGESEDQESQAGKPDLRERGSSLAECLAPFRDRAYWPFLLFRDWLSFANGISQSAQFLWTKDVLGFSLLANNMFRSTMQAGQLILSIRLARYFDAAGYRRALIGAQLMVTVGLGCYLLARPESFSPFFWIGLGWACWSFYAVHNVALPNLALKFAPPEQRAGYIAAYEALGSLLHAAATIGGGLLFDELTFHLRPLDDEAFQYACISMLSLGVIARAFAIPLAALIQEPAAVR
jgi:Na+/melibiose symporter-like transporter